VAHPTEILGGVPGPLCNALPHPQCVCVYTVLDGSIESSLQALNSAYGDQTQMTCTPLRSFESFAEQVLKVDGDLARKPFKRIVCDGDERLYWVVFTISYRGSHSLRVS